MSKMFHVAKIYVHIDVRRAIKCESELVNDLCSDEMAILEILQTYDPWKIA